MHSDDDFQSMLAGLGQTGLSHAEIARDVGVARNTVWRISTGEIRDPRYSTGKSIEKLYQKRCAATHVEQKRA